MRKKLTSSVLTASLIAATLLTGCGGNTSSEGNTSTTTSAAGSTAANSTAKSSTASSTKEGSKPGKISIMVDGTLVTQANGRDAFEKKWEDLTGIDLVINQPDHDAYYDQVSQVMASGDLPDVILLDSTHYAAYAGQGVLADITDYYAGSDLEKRVNEAGHQSIVDGTRIDGKLYGFAPTRGNGCVTYVKKKWLDNCGLSVPTNFDEYEKMLEAFTTGDPDGNGTNGDTYGVSAAGFIGGEAPYTNYLPEFYGMAHPSFYKKEDGTWADGFTEDAMKEALQKMQDAYNNGLIDKETLTNGTSDCRNKFYADKFGVFTYWAGTWNTNLKTNLEANGLDGELVALPPISEVGTYVERIAPIWCITSACKDPEAVYHNFIESMLDGGDMELLWTYGVEGTHWSVKGETLFAGQPNEVTYKEGEFHMLENLEKAGTQYTKNHIDPMLALVNIKDDPGAATVAEEARKSAEVFNANSKVADLVPNTDVMTQYNGDLTTLKNEIVAKVVAQNLSVEDAYKEYEAGHGAEWSKAIVDSLNAAK